MAGGAFFFAVMALMVKLIPRIPVFELVVCRGAVGLVASLLWLRATRQPLFGVNHGWLLARGLLGFCGLCLYFYTIPRLPLAEAVTVQYTNPFFTALLAPFVVGEKWRGGEWMAGLVAFLGVVLIADPSVPSRWPLVALGLGGALCSAMAYTVVRKLGRMGESPVAIVLYFPLVAVILGLPLAIPEWVWPTPREWLLLLGLGLATQVAQILLTMGLRAERAARATVVNFLVIGFSALFGLFLGEAVRPMALIGMGCIGVSLIVLSRLRSS